VNRKSTLPIPEAIMQLQRQLDQFRSTQPRRTKLPEPLWQARQGLAAVCKTGTEQGFKIANKRANLFITSNLLAKSTALISGRIRA
jgi:hypothetical protein